MVNLKWGQNKQVCNTVFHKMTIQILMSGNSRWDSHKWEDLNMLNQSMVSLSMETHNMQLHSMPHHKEDQCEAQWQKV